MLTRRKFLCALLLVPSAASLLSCTDDPPRVLRVGIAGRSASRLDEDRRSWQGLVDELHERGWTEGHNVAFEFRYHEGDPIRLRELMTELVALDVDVIYAMGVPAVEAAKQATDRIPIVFNVGDALGRGIVTNLARPEGNVTGVSGRFAEGNLKRTELLKRLAPQVTRVANLLVTRNGYPPSLLQQLPAGITAFVVAFNDPDDVGSVMARVAAQSADGIVVSNVGGSPQFERQLVSAIAEAGLPAVYGSRNFVINGGLCSLGGVDAQRQVAVYIDKILRGARPAELPVERPLTADLAINLTTARMLGLTVPRDLIVRADWIVA
jgi:ABC-type uncharacterized transport system substrate-binding protein